MLKCTGPSQMKFEREKSAFQLNTYITRTFLHYAFGSAHEKFGVGITTRPQPAFPAETGHEEWLSQSKFN